MSVKKIVVVVVTALAALTMSVGCRNVDDSKAGQSDTAVDPSDPVVLELQSGTAPAPANAMRLKPSPVTCSGDQNHGGRLCCDATHCCINILGVINCKLPPPVKK